MAIQKQISKENTTSKRTEGLGVSLNSVRKTTDKTIQSQNERNAQEIDFYWHDIRKSIMVGGAVIAGELLLYFLHVIK